MSEVGDKSGSGWGAFELCVFFLCGWAAGVVYALGAGGGWLGEYPYTGAVFLIVLANVPVALAAPTVGGKVIRFLAPMIFPYLFYSAAASEGGGFVEILQQRLGVAHFLLVAVSALAASLLTGARRERAPAVQPAAEPVAPVAAPPPGDAFERIVGQAHVIKPLKEIAEIAGSGIRVGKRNAPHAVLLFLGPTGVGKTEAARALAQAVYGSENALIRFDMGQFTDSSQANRFYGPPPGYVGSEEGGQLTNAVRRKPRSVVLLDEMEKAHPQIWDAFLPVFDEGYIVDGSTNVKVDMTNTIIVLTSNLLAGDPGVTELSPEEVKDRVQATGVLRPELVGRINEILVFKPLDTPAIAEILRRRMDTALWSLSEQGISITVDEPTIESLVEQVKAAKFGVRQIDDVVRKYLRKAIADARGTPAG